MFQGVVDQGLGFRDDYQMQCMNICRELENLNLKPEDLKPLIPKL